MSVELAQAYVTIIPTTKGAEDAIATELTTALGGDVTKTAGDAAGSAIGAGVMSGLGKAVAPVAILGGVTAAAKGLYDIGETFDGAYDAIALGTGATGEALDSLNASFTNVVATMPGDVQVIADSMAEINTRTGATGETLEGLTSQFVALDAIGYAADIDTVTASFNAWGIEADSMGGYLDDLFTISQSTGTSMDELASGVSASAGAWSSMGFTYEQAAAMVGQFERAGLNASGMTQKLAQNIGGLTLEGETNQDALNRCVGEMEDLIAAGDTAAARDIAESLFGTKNADAFIQALETGAVDITALNTALGENDGAILASEQGTRDMAESFELLKNNAALALEPLGSALFVALGELFQGMVEPIAAISQGVRDFAQGIADGEGTFSTFATVGGTIKEAFEKLVELGATLGAIVMPTLSEVFGTLAGDVGIAAGGLATLVSDGLTVLIDLANGDFTGAKETFLGMFTDLGTTVNDLIDNTFPGLVEFVSGMVTDIGGFFGTIGETFTGFTDGISGAFEGMKEIVQGIFDFIGGIVETVAGWLGFLNDAEGMSQEDMANYDPSGGLWGTGGIARHADGGITRKLHIVGEAGPEAIVPLYPGAMDPFADSVAERLGGAANSESIDALRSDIANMGIYLDGRVLVGSIAPQMDRAIGRRGR